MIFLDTESVGFSGPPILIQWKRLNGTYTEHSVWDVPVSETLDLIQDLLHEDSLVIFNATHDSFVLTKWYNVFNLVADKSRNPDPKEIRRIENELDYSKILCLKPNKVFDFYLILKQTLFNFAVGRLKRPVEIRMVPAQMAKPLKGILERFAVQLPSILFEKFKNKLPGDYWEVIPNKTKGFVDLQLNFNPSLGLKSIIKFLYPNEQVQTIELPKHFMPNEEHFEYQPWNNEWPKLLGTHREYWRSEKAQKYAKNDIVYLEWLHKLLVDKNLFPNGVHIDSDLAWHVGAARAKGFCIDINSAKEMLEKCKKSLVAIPDSSARESLTWLRSVCPPELQWLLQNTDTKKTLIPLSKMEGTGELGERCKQLMAQRTARKKIDILTKLISVGRFHANFEVSGTLSNRMSGQGGINPQGIMRDREFRELFLMADEDQNLSGGDFSAQEITILDVHLKDAEFSKAIAKNKKAAHEYMAWCLFGQDLPEYEPTKDQYYRAKQVDFAYVYGAKLATLAKTSQVSIEQTDRGIQKFIEHFPGVKKFADSIYDKFCSMKQPGGLGTNVEWHEPEHNATSIFGFSRNYVLDNKIAKFIFELAGNPPEELQEIKGRITRRDREQSLVGATQSSLYATAFSIQAENLRTAGNHYIQSAGATITKTLQHTIWRLQPEGVESWIVQLYNVHDELLVVSRIPEKINEIVDRTINLLRKIVPLLEIEWKMDIGSWAEVKD